MFAALFGVGGGIVVVPLLVMLLGFPPKAAVSTSLVAIAITAGFGAIVYAVLGRVHWDDAALIGLPAVLGGLIGTGVQSRISSRVLSILSCAVHRRDRSASPGRVTIEVVQTIALGVSAGVLSGLFGVGGGLLFVPALVLVGDLSQLDAAATSLAAMLPVVVVGTAVQARRGLVQWRVTMVVGLVSAGGVIAGATLAESLPEVTLRRLFAVLLLVIAARLAWSVRRPGSMPTGG